MYDIDSIKHKLIKELPDSSVSVIDESHKHIGHIGYNNTKPSHIRIDIISKIFIGLNSVKCHQMIYRTLQEEISHGLHAISIKCNSR